MGAEGVKQAVLKLLAPLADQVQRSRMTKGYRLYTDLEYQVVQIEPQIRQFSNFLCGKAVPVEVSQSPITGAPIGREDPAVPGCTAKG